jgi:hypothetical protein
MMHFQNLCIWCSDYCQFDLDYHVALAIQIVWTMSKVDLRQLERFQWQRSLIVLWWTPNKIPQHVPFHLDA